MKHEIIDGCVIQNRELVSGVFRMDIRWSAGAERVKPGQFVNVYPKSRDTLLPRPISICRAEDDRLTLVYGVVGKGTREFSGYKAGETVRISSPLGNGYDLSVFENTAGQEPALLIGGGIGVPPMLQLARALREKGVPAQAVLGFRAEPFLLEEFEEAGAALYVATDNGAFGYKGTVLELIRREGLRAGACFACGPRGMLRAVSAFGEEMNMPTQVSMEERMGCGYGACVGCVCSLRDADGTVRRKKVCKDGPVFDGKAVVWDE